ncbi:hypothetical protein ACLOJK_026411 [Asimina triloba]
MLSSYGFLFRFGPAIQQKSKTLGFGSYSWPAKELSLAAASLASEDCFLVGFFVVSFFSSPSPIAGRTIPAAASALRSYNKAIVRSSRVGESPIAKTPSSSPHNPSQNSILPIWFTSRDEIKRGQSDI